MTTLAKLFLVVSEMDVNGIDMSHCQKMLTVLVFVPVAQCQVKSQWIQGIAYSPL